MPACQRASQPGFSRAVPRSRGRVPAGLLRGGERAHDSHPAQNTGVDRGQDSRRPECQEQSSGLSSRVFTKTCARRLFLAPGAGKDTTWLGSLKWLLLFRDSGPGPSDSMACALSMVLFCSDSVWATAQTGAQLLYLLPPHPPLDPRPRQACRLFSRSACFAVSGPGSPSGPVRVSSGSPARDADSSPHLSPISRRNIPGWK